MWAGLDVEGHVGSIDMLENTIAFNVIFVMKMMPPTTKRVCVGKLGRGGTCRIN